MEENETALTTLPTRLSSDEDWIIWYDVLQFSQQDNNKLFIKAWKGRSHTDANTQRLRDAMKLKGLLITDTGEISAVAPSMLGGITPQMAIVMGVVCIGALAIVCQKYMKDGKWVVQNEDMEFRRKILLLTED